LANRTPKVSPERWLEAARKVLVDEGVDHVKVDRLAALLGVTRGGFYHHFRNRTDLLDRLLVEWETGNSFIPPSAPLKTPGDASHMLVEITRILIEERDYDPGFDVAVREWARRSKKAKAALDRVDQMRIDFFDKVFRKLGYEPREAFIRARVTYFHQVGYYALAVKETKAQRFQFAELYLKILAGALYSTQSDGAVEQPRPRSMRQAALHQD
jgi:AcrR family transcriptional regulator